MSLSLDDEEDELESDELLESELLEAAISASV